MTVTKIKMTYEFLGPFYTSLYSESKHTRYGRKLGKTGMAAIPGKETAFRIKSPDGGPPIIVGVGIGDEIQVCDTAKEAYDCAKKGIPAITQEMSPAWVCKGCEITEEK